jgi:hypothetical protein
MSNASIFLNIPAFDRQSTNYDLRTCQFAFKQDILTAFEWLMAQFIGVNFE